ncbi:hypothetical protein [Mycobacteroides abscessus]|uniref:hypothetical protein n=1 Tax=Mycobacteroides abscessus TaxID=36809 RepID=UPI00025882B6|nr:hypothetical protein [Mycobacteroides abscessus]EIC62279.1 hypothetical protein S7W_24141 [Mycobacteroides abscessus M94]SKZ50491.1 Uncharacterised protein [Mycobacteroides abscessus subsp. abscessus]
MPSREVIVREVLLTDNLTYTAADDRETKRLVRTIRLEGDERLQVDGTSTFTITATSAETNMTADQWHTMIAAARIVLLELERAGKSVPESTLTANLAQRGFTPADIRDGVNLLRGEKLVARRDGAIHDLTGTEQRAKRRLSPASLAPRNSAPSSGTPVSNRPNMGVDGRLIEHPDHRVDMGARLRAQAEQMPSASFEVGEVPAAAKPITNKPTAPTIPYSAIVTYIDAILDAFARHNKPSATWKDLGVRLPSTELPSGSTKQTTAAAALDKLAASGTIRHESGVYTYVPAESAVAGLTKWIRESAKAGVLITPAAARALAQREDVQRLTPNGWNAEGLVALALDAVVTSGVIERVEGGWMKPAPKVDAKPVAPAPAPKPTPKPAGDTTSTKPKTEGNKSTKPDTETPAAGFIPVLEKKVDVLTTEVRAIGARLHTLPPPPTAEKVLLDEADSAVKSLLESVCVRLKLDDPLTEGAIHRALPGRSKPSRVNPNPVDKRLRLGEALALGVDARILAFDHITRKYRLIAATPLMSKAALDRRVQRIKDIRDAAKEKNKNKDKKDAA